MSGPIQVIPQGLLGLLQLKQQGMNPSQLADYVTPQIDLFPLWIQRQTQGLVQSGDTQALATGAVGPQPFSTSVPATQAWFIEHMCISAIMGAADTCRIAPAVRDGGPAGTTYCVDRDWADTITARARQLRTATNNFWVGPNQTFSMVVFDILAGTTITFGLVLRGVIVPI